MDRGAPRARNAARRRLPALRGLPRATRAPTLPPPRPPAPASPARAQHGGANMAERMRLASEEPCAKLSAIAARIVAVIKERDVLATEAEHYEEKVARLAAESAAAPADRAKKDHLDGNKGKLAAAAGALQAKQASAAAAVAQMDRDLDALLTPFVDKLIKQQLRYHSDSVAFIGICTDLAKGAAAAAPAAAHHHHHQPSPPPPAGSKTPPEPIRVAPVESLPPLDLEPKPPGTPKVLPPAAASKLGAAVMARRSRRDLGAPPALPPKAGATSPASSGPAPPVESTLFRSVGDFKQEREGDLALTKGQLLVIFQRMPNGWWRARVGAELGICPSNFLAEVRAGPRERPACAGLRLARVRPPAHPAPRRPPTSRPAGAPLHRGARRPHARAVRLCARRKGGAAPDAGRPRGRARCAERGRLVAARAEHRRRQRRLRAVQLPRPRQDGARGGRPGRRGAAAAAASLGQAAERRCPPRRRPSRCN